jgi:ribosome-associated translation inhibitor RaiA
MADPPDATVTMVKDAHHQFKTDITLHVGKNLVVHCTGSDSDPYKSVSSSLAKLESQIRRYKTRLRDKKRHAANHEHRSELVQKFVIKPQEEDTHDDNPLIIAETTSEIHTLSVGDAVMRMDLSATPVVIFRNALDTSQEDFDNIVLKTFNKCYPKEDERNVMLEKFNEKKVEVRTRLINFFKLIDEKPDKYGDHYREYLSIKKEYDLHKFFDMLDKMRKKGSWNL